MRKFYHFLPKPAMPIMTRAERLAERAEIEKQILFAKFYGLGFLGLMVLFLLVGFVRMVFAEDDLEILHAEICQAVPKSPLCEDFEDLRVVDTLAKKKGVPTRLVIGIWNAESTIGTNFNKPVCYSYYNWAGLKGKKFDDGRVEMYADDRRKPDENGCWLYKFKDWEDGVNSFLNTLAIGYRGCNHKTRCIAYDFVGNPNVAEESWIRNVEKFYKPE